jgi:hypothetical protein
METNLACGCENVAGQNHGERKKLAFRRRIINRPREFIDGNGGRDLRSTGAGRDGELFGYAALSVSRRGLRRRTER